ncbi:MAG TPA: fibronectin type III domain-containing protein [Bacteroidetes bacterium]|nr:fibronectin type III domain-containing protein [Bacteroidota bacterium]
MKHIISLLFIFLSFHLFSQTQQFAFAGKNGIFVHLGINIPNGRETDYFNIERKTENGEWQAIAKIKFPVNIENFKRDYNIYKKLFPYINTSVNIDDLYGKLSRSNTVRDTLVARDINLMALRLAAGNVFYDQNIDKYVLYQYRVTEFKIDGSHTQMISDIENYPGISSYSPIKVLLFSRTDSTDYIKWRSVNGENPYWVALYHYDNKNAVFDDTPISHYSVNDTVYYFTEIKKSKFKQYFIIPFDYYGNQGKPSEIAYLQKIKPAVNYFSNISAKRSDDRLQINLKWELKNIDDIKEIDILRSDDFNGQYKKISTVTNQTNSFTDIAVEPDRIYYYQLSALLTFSNQRVKTIRFHGFGFEKQAPVPPYIDVFSNNEKAIGFKLSGSGERFLRGVRVYRKMQNTNLAPQLISDLIELKADTAIFVDTTSLEGGFMYEYYAKSENTSHLESDFSQPVIVQSMSKIYFVPVTGLSDIVYNNSEIHLFWDDIKSEIPQIVGYRLYRKKEPGEWENLLKPDSLFVLNRYVDKGLEPGEYEYKICPLDFMFREGAGSVIKVNIQQKSRFTGPDLVLTATDKGIQIKPSKIAIKNVKAYKIFKYQRGKDPKFIKELPVSTESYIDKKVKKGKLYFYFIILTDNQGKESLPGREAGLRY